MYYCSMKKLLLILLCLPLMTLAQQTYVPDDNFEAYLEANGMGDGITLNDSVLTSNINTITYLSVPFENISDLTGIQDFTALTNLYCNYNNLTSLVVSGATALAFLDCGNNQLTSLDVSGATALAFLDCRSNQLTSLDVSQNTALYNLFTVSNQITSLVVSGATALTYLYCSGNLLSNLDVSNNLALTHLGCSNNQLTSLDVRNGNNMNMYSLGCTSNYNLYCINVDDATYSTANWTNIDPWAGFNNNCQLALPGCTDSTNINYDPSATVNDSSCIYAKTYVPDNNFENHLEVNGMGDGIANNDSVYTHLIASQTNLNMEFYSIADLTGIEDFTALAFLDCSLNQLTSLDLSQNTVLTHLNCWMNHLTSLDVSANTALTILSCGNNQLTSLDVRNGNNVNMSNGNFNAYNNPNLSCISVDDTVYSNANWTNIDPQTQFSNDCYAVSGCTDSLAVNYNPNATIDNGSCIYPAICVNAAPTGLNTTNVVQNRATINWDNMNDSLCMVDQYRIKFRAVGSSTFTQKTMGQPVNSCLWAANNTDKLILNLTPSTQYEYQMKAWYCDGSGTSVTSAWTALHNFTTEDDCPNVGNLTVTTSSTTQATFTWNGSNGAYSFTRIKARVDTNNGTWFNVGGTGVNYGTFTKNKNGLNPGTSYRAQARTWCDPAGGPWKSPQWTSLVYWTQPVIRLEGGNTITNLAIYPNPSKDVFNITFTSEEVQNLKVKVLNVIGEELISDNLEQFIGEYTKQIDLINNAKGIYFLEIETNNGVINKKLILQ